MIINVENLTKSVQEVDKHWIDLIYPTVWDHVSLLYAKYQEAVISSCWENCYKKFFLIRPPDIHITIVLSRLSLKIDN
jgi:hypothetical protein